MSFRHTYVTEYFYKSGKENDLKIIRSVLEKWGTVKWEGQGINTEKIYGYFHGVIKDLDRYETKKDEQKIIDDLAKVGCRIKIVFE